MARNLGVIAVAWMLACSQGAGSPQDGAVTTDDPMHANDASIAPPPASMHDGGVQVPDASVDEAGSQCSAGLAAPSFDLPRLPVADDDSDAGSTTAAVVPELTAGPIVGAVTDHSVKLWIRTNAPAISAVVLWTADDDTDQRTVSGPTVDETTDFVGVIELQNLDIDTEYRYRIALAAPGSPPQLTDPQGGFSTLPRTGRPARIRFAVGADITGAGEQPIFAQVAATEPDFVLLIGDQIYADSIDPNVPSYAEKYLNNWQISNLRDLMGKVPTLMIWDDHDIVDNFYPGKSERYEPARIAYELYCQAHNPPPLREDALYYTFEAADVGFFVLDVRSHRSPNEDPDGPDKTMLGARQKADLMTWLACSSHRIKVVVSPVVFSRWARTESDSWNGFAHEREEIFSFIASKKIDDVLLLTGDQHWSAVFRTVYDDYRFYEFLPTPLSKERSPAPTDETPDILARDDDNFVFGIVDIDTVVDPPEIALTLCAEGRPCNPAQEPEPTSTLDTDGTAENVPFTIHLTTEDLGPSPGTSRQ